MKTQRPKVSSTILRGGSPRIPANSQNSVCGDPDTAPLMRFKPIRWHESREGILPVFALLHVSVSIQHHAVPVSVPGAFCLTRVFIPVSGFILASRLPRG